MKRCTKCLLELPLTEFVKNGVGGLRPDCRGCMRKPSLRPKTDAERFWSRVVQQDGCWDWRGTFNSNGYAYVHSGGVSGPASRVSWRLRHGEIPPGLAVCHRCDNPRRTRPDHLFLGTQRENVRDAIAKRRHVAPKGEANGKARLTAALVISLRAEFAGGDTVAVIARRHGLSYTTASAAIKGESWSHVSC